MHIVNFLFILSGLALARCAKQPGQGHVMKQEITYTADALADQVFSLPGWGDLDTFNMFSG